MNAFTATQIAVRNVVHNKILYKLRTFIKHCLLLFLYSIVSFNVVACARSPCCYIKMGLSEFCLMVLFVLFQERY